MFNDISLILTNFLLLAATSILSVVWVLDRFRMKQYKKSKHRRALMVRISYDFLPILLVIMILRSYVIEPFKIPSESMYPLLTTGDYVLVSKSSYGLKFPFTNYTLFNLSDPQKGDVAVFQSPLNSNEFFIKRIMGVGGDTLQWIGDDLLINGIPLQRDRAVGNYSYPSKVSEYERFDWEQIDNGRRYIIRRLSENDMSRFNMTSGYLLLHMENLSLKEGKGLQEHYDNLKITIPPGFYFVMGDNRDQSSDSREWGLVSQNDLVGRADYLLGSTAYSNNLIFKFSFDRFKKLTP